MKCPYLGLQPYSEEDQEFFFGRETDRRVIVSNLYATSLTVLYGPSGVGKSSVLLAGVVPDLKSDPENIIVIFREWHESSFLVNLKKKCLQTAEKTLKRKTELSSEVPFDELLDKLSQIVNGRILILFDQFEDYLSNSPEKIQNSFDIEFSRAVNRTDSDLGFLLIIREDGLHKLDRFKIRIGTLFKNMLRLDHLNITGAEDAIRKPLEKLNSKTLNPSEHYTIEDELVKQILIQTKTDKATFSQTANWNSEYVGTTDENEYEAVEAAFLQLVLTRIWNEETKENSKSLRLSTLERLGGAKQIASTHLDTVINDFGKSEIQLCSIIFDRLVSPSGSKIALPANDLAKYAKVPDKYLSDVLKILTNKRILRCITAPSDKTNDPFYEIFHDLLAKAILDWQVRYKQSQVEEEVTNIRHKASVATKNYNSLRQTLGWLILSFPFILVMGSKLLENSGIQDSISSYYYSKMRDVYVGMLIAIAIIFQSYSGYDKLDKIASKLSSFLLIGLALFPGVNARNTASYNLISGYIHYFSFSLFFLIQIFFLLFSFTKGTYMRTPAKIMRNKIYRICGITAFLCFTLMPLGSLYFKSIVFWLEVTCFISIGIAWLTKGKAIYREHEEF